MKKAHRAAAQDAKKKDRQTKAELRKGRNARKYGDTEWKQDFDKFTKQLALIGLTIKDVAGDGNCMFRAIADQLEGDPTRHDDYRQRICDFLQQHEEDFAPFVEDDRTLDQHIASMRRNATWGGHMELQAASLLLHVNFCIHQLEQPRWEIVNHAGGGRNSARFLHLSYHDGEHYASVRNIGDDLIRVGTPSPIAIIQPTAAPSAGQKSAAPVQWDGLDTNWQEDLVLRSTTASNPYFVRAVLLETDGDTDAAIEYIISLSSDGDLEESFQRDFAYEHGIFPPGGFPEDEEEINVPQESSPAPSTSSKSSESKNKVEPNNIKPTTEPSDSSDATKNGSEKAENKSGSSSPSNESIQALTTDTSVTSSSASGTTSTPPPQSSVTTSEKSSSENPENNAPNAMSSSNMENLGLTDEEFALMLQQEESAQWEREFMMATSIATSDTSSKPSSQRKPAAPASSATAKPKESAKPTANSAKAKKGTESPPRAAASQKSAAQKLERFQNQHISNKQRHAMKRMEKEKPPTPQPTKASAAAPAATAEATDDGPADLGSLRI